MAGSGPAAVGATGEQFYVTHCVTADSVMNAPGYSVRAASDAGNAAALRLALEYPPYELPLELWRDRPTKAMSPRRLTRTPHPHGGVWVVHSVYLEKDTMNRDRSYFSHLLLLPAATDAASVLRSWDAPGWVKEYPQKADKTLPRGRLPVGTAVSDESLAEFIANPGNGPADLAVVVCPPRLRQDAAVRKDLVMRFLQGVLLATHKDSDRDRFFVHAEPGLVAMLLYAATRLLPSSSIDDLTFSTFEPAHRSLRDYGLAAVIGTYTGPTGKGLDADLVTNQGYGLDTFRLERSSKELATGRFTPGLSELIDLAGQGEWELVADVQRMIGTDADALGRVGRAIPLARAVARMKSGTPTIDDLLALKMDPQGAVALNQHADKAWPHVRAAAYGDARIRASFKDWLAEPARLDEFRKDAAKALLKGDLEGWEASWGVVRDAAAKEKAKDQLEKAVKSLDDQLPNLPMPARNTLRTACAGVGLMPDHHLLAPTSPDELAALLSTQVPPEWQGYTCFAVMGPDDKNWLLPSTAPYRAAFRDRVRKHIAAAPPAVLAGYLKQARPFISSDPVFLYNFLKPFTKASPVFLDRLIDAAAGVVDATDWIKLLEDLNVYNAPEWQGFLFQNDHLAKLLAGFKADPVATKVWGDYLDLLSTDLFDDDEWELTLYGQLRKAREALGRAGIPAKSILPEGGTVKLNAIDCLFAVIEKPETAANLHPGELLRSIQTFWPQDPLTGLRMIYFKGGFDQLDLPRQLPRLDAYLAAFRSCYPVTHEYFSARSAVTAWLELSLHCPEETRAEFQAHFVRQCVPREWFRNLLDESRRVPFLPEADARLRQMLHVPAASSGYVRPVATTGGGQVETFSSPATKKARKDKARARGVTRRNQTKGMSGGAIAVIVVGLLSLIMIVVVVATKFGDSSRATTEPTDTKEHVKPKPDEHVKPKPDETLKKPDKKK